MNTSEQKCGCGNKNELVSIALTKENQNKGLHLDQIIVNPIDRNRKYIVGTIDTPAGSIPRVATRLEAADYIGAAKVRWGMNRNNYRVEPGVYAVGSPTDRSDVFVTANYKLTFDIVRKNLAAINAWLLVLDTKGINVWCASGKGTFGTKELVNRIQATFLEKIVRHKRIILPQLGAVGVAAHLVKESTGFTVIYGPIRASDIHAFIQAGYKATKEMRRVRFDWTDRIKLVPNDFIYNLRYLGIAVLLFFILSGINGDGFSVTQASGRIVFLSSVILAGYISGVVFTPLLLPYLIFRNFSFKGLFTGGVVASAIVLSGIVDRSLFMIPIIFLIVTAISSFLAMNFTGSSTYTSLAGVKKEMRIAVPIQITSGVVAAVLVILQGFISGR